MFLTVNKGLLFIILLSPIAVTFYKLVFSYIHIFSHPSQCVIPKWLVDLVNICIHFVTTSQNLVYIESISHCWLLAVEYTSIHSNITNLHILLFISQVGHCLTYISCYCRYM